MSELPSILLVDLLAKFKKNTTMMKSEEKSKVIGYLNQTRLMNFDMDKIYKNRYQMNFFQKKYFLHSITNVFKI